MPLRLQPAPMDEDARIAGAIAGERAHVEWIVEEYSGPAYQHAMRMLRDEQDARDVTQEVMLKVITNLHSYDSRYRFGAWVHGITRNACVDLFRRRGRVELLPEVAAVEEREGPHEQVERRAQAARLEAAVASLPLRYREVVVLYHFQHLKYREIAKTLDVPMGTVMNRLFRARAMLREAIPV